MINKLDMTMSKHRNALNCSMLGKKLQDEYILKKGLNLCQECIREYQEILQNEKELETQRVENILDNIVYLEMIVKNGNEILRSKIYKIDKSLISGE